MQIIEALNVAKRFLALQLSANFYSIKFSGAKMSSGIWTIDCSFVEIGSTIRKSIQIQVSDSNGAVTSFNFK